MFNSINLLFVFYLTILICICLNISSILYTYFYDYFKSHKLYLPYLLISIKIQHIHIFYKSYKITKGIIILNCFALL